MPQKTVIENITRMLSVLKLMATDTGATVTEISKATGIDRWTAKDMIDQLEGLSPNGKGLCIEELENPIDKRQVRYHISKESLWTMSIPEMNLTDDEGILFELMFEQFLSSPILKESAVNLKKKLSLFKSVKHYQIFNATNVKKVTTKKTRDVMIAILNAIEENKCINFSYKPVGREVTSYQLMPLGVFSYNGGFYLAAQKLLDGEYRSFGLERVATIPSTFVYDGELPEKYDYIQLFDDPFGPFGHKEPFEAVLKFDSFHGFYNLEKDWPNSVKVEVQDDETVIVKAKTASFSGIRQYIMGFGNGVEVLEPQWLRTSIRNAHLLAANQYPDEEPTDNQ